MTTIAQRAFRDASAIFGKMRFFMMIQIVLGIEGLPTSFAPVAEQNAAPRFLVFTDDVLRFVNSSAVSAWMFSVFMGVHVVRQILLVFKLFLANCARKHLLGHRMTSFKVHL